MSLDFSDIGQTTNGEAEELTIECSCNRLSNTGFANTRGTDETDDFAFHCSAELPDGEELKNTVFDIAKSIMVFVKYFDGILDGEVLFGMLTPWNLVEN